MKNLYKNLLLLTILLASFGQTSAHYLWIQTPETGQLGKPQEVKVFFGEYTYGVIEEPAGKNFSNVKNFHLWVESPSGQKTEVNATAKKDAFVGEFTPTERGTYTVVLNNNEIEVINYTQYDFGIFKTHYHSTAKVVVGAVVESTAASNDKGLVVINASKISARVNGEVVLQVLYKGQPVKEQEVSIYVADLWSKQLRTDGNGEVKFDLPWSTTYTIETTTKEEIPGSYKGEAYEFIWHCATYSIVL